MRALRIPTTASALVLLLMTAPLAFGASPTLNMMSKTFHLGSYNDKAKPMWEFVTGAETVDNWTSLVTVIDRPDAHSLTDLDNLAQGTLSTFKNSGAKILLAKTFKDASGKPYNYLVAAIDEPDKHRYELNFLKIGLGTQEAYILIYAVRISGSDYKAKAATYLNQQSNTVGKALDTAPVPDTPTLPRKTF